MRKEFVVVIGFLLLSLVGAPAYAIDIGGKSFGPNDVLPVAESQGFAGPIESDEFGTATSSILNLGPCEMMPRSAADFTTVEATSCISLGVLSGQVRVQPGQRFTSPMVYRLQKSHCTTMTPTRLPIPRRASGESARQGLLREFSSSIPGFSPLGTLIVTITLDTPHTVDNTANKYHYLVALDRVVATPAEQERIYRVAIKYRRQISPAPLTATFTTDVPTTHPFFRFVEALAASGVTGGCGAGAYCPDQPVTRGQMAVFLSTALGLHWPN